MYQQPTAPQLIGGVLDSAFSLWRASSSQVIGIALASSVASSLWRLFDNTFDYYMLDSILKGTFDPTEAPGNPLPMLVCLLVGLYFYLGVIARMAAVAAIRPVSGLEALRRALLRYPAMLLFFGVYIGVSAAMVLVSVLPMVAISALGLPLPLLIVLTVLLLLVFAFVLWVYWYFAIFLLVARNIGGIAALRTSFRLVRGNWWRTAATLTVAYFVYSAVLLLVSAFAAAFGALADFGDISVNATVFVVEAVGRAIAMPFMIAVSLAMLKDLELRRTGSDLADRIRELGS